MQRPRWAPADVDLDRPSVARVYDYFLGGAHNFAVDRALAQEVARLTPNVADSMRANREFLRRVVRFLLDAGIDQFLDIGSGIPTVGNVHEIAQQENPDARIFYVDVDPVAVSHSKAILNGNPRAKVMRGDAREPERILTDPELTDLIDLDRPVAVLLAGVLHFVPDADDPAAITAWLINALRPGSYLAISHATGDGQPQEFHDAQKLSARTPTELVLRPRAEVAGLFHDADLVEPGLVFLPLWRADDPDEAARHPERMAGYGGVALL